MFKMLAKSRTEVAVQAAFSIDGSYDLWNSDVAFQLHTKTNPDPNISPYLATNQSFYDSSSFNNSVQKVGDICQGSSSPYATGGGSAYMDEDGDYLYINNSNLAPGANDFTLETWICPTRSGYILSQSNPSVTSNNDISLGLILTSNWNVAFLWNVGGAQASFTSSAQVAPRKWTHVAVTRTGGQLRLFINGVLDKSAAVGTSVFNVLSSSANTFIGLYAPEGNSTKYAGYLSDTRLVVDSAVYTANFTPPTAPLTAIPGTRLLLNYANYLYSDAARNSNILMVAGTSIVDNSSSEGRCFRMSGGNSFLLSPAADGSLEFDTGDFTVELWSKIVAQDRDGATLITNFSAYAPGGIGIYAGHKSASMTKYSVWIAPGSTAAIVSTVDIVFNKWTHIALVRSSGILYLYIDGVMAGYAAYTGSVKTVGRWSIAESPNDYWYSYDGYMRFVRVTRRARYLSNFTPRLTESLDVSPSDFDPYFDKTVTLIDFEAGDGGGNFTEYTGKYLINLGVFAMTSVKATGNSSGYFNGTSCMRLPSSKDFAIGTGDYTVEAYVNSEAFSDHATIFGGSENGSLIVSIDAGAGISTNPYGTNVGKIYFPYAFQTGVFYHVAVVRRNNYTSFFVNGKCIGSAVDNNNYAQSLMVVGSADPGIQFFKGWIDSLRVSRVARYSKNFTPPASLVNTDRQYASIESVKYDNYWTNVVLSIDSATMTDRKGAATTAFGGLSSDSSGSKFGSCLNFDQNGKYLQLNYVDTLYNWSDVNFTIDAWVTVSSMASASYTNNGNPLPTMLGKRNPLANADYWSFGPMADGSVCFAWLSGGNHYTVTTSTGLIHADETHHLAFSKHNNVIEIYVDGICRARRDYVNVITAGASVLSIGRVNNVNFLGKVEDLRFTKDKARYTKDFSVPSAVSPAAGLLF